MNGEIDLNDLCLRLAAAAARARAIDERALQRACVVLQKDAKARIGKYQDAIGPFQDWPELAESTKEQRERLGYPADEPLLREGTLRNSIEFEVHGTEAVVGSKMDIAAHQEFGTAKIPPRPFLGPAAYKKREKIEKLLGEAVVEGLFGGGQRVNSALGYDMDLG